MFFSMMTIDINYVRVFIIQIYLQPKRDTGTIFPRLTNQRLMHKIKCMLVNLYQTAEAEYHLSPRKRDAVRQLEKVKAANMEII